MDIIIDNSKKRKRQKLIAIGAGIVVVLVLVFSFKDSGQRKYTSSIDKFTIATVTQAIFNDYIAIEGKALPMKSIFLDAIEGGVIEKVLVEDGELVVRNQPLIELSNTNLQLDIMARQTSLYELMDRLQTTKINYEKNRTNLLLQLSDLDYQFLEAEKSMQISASLIQEKVISTKEGFDIENKYKYLKNKRLLTKKLLIQDSLSAMEAVKQMRDGIDRMHENMKVMKTKLGHLVIKAPLTGKLTSLDAVVGELKQQGSHLAKIDLPNDFKIMAAVDEFYINKITEGQKGNMTLQNKIVDIEVNKIYPNVKNGKFDIELYFSDKNDNITFKGVKKGQTFYIKLALSDSKNALVVPKGQFYNQTGGNWIFVLKDNKAIKRDISIGRQNPEYLEVTGGLSENEQVIISGYDNLEKVDVIEF